MIDTDKYEGHTPAEQWKVIDGLGEDPPVDFVAMSNANADEYGCCENQSILAHAWQIFDGSEEKTGKAHDWKAIKGADARLIADAPKLLAEVKRLRELYTHYYLVANHYEGDRCLENCPICYGDD